MRCALLPSKSMKTEDVHWYYQLSCGRQGFASRRARFSVVQIKGGLICSRSWRTLNCGGESKGRSHVMYVRWHHISRGRARQETTGDANAGERQEATVNSAHPLTYSFVMAAIIPGNPQSHS
jgi:hypothetical protein